MSCLIIVSWKRLGVLGNLLFRKVQWVFRPLGKGPVLRSFTVCRHSIRVGNSRDTELEIVQFGSLFGEIRIRYLVFLEKEGKRASGVSKGESSCCTSLRVHVSTSVGACARMKFHSVRNEKFRASGLPTFVRASGVV